MYRVAQNTFKHVITKITPLKKSVIYFYEHHTLGFLDTHVYNILIVKS